MRKIVMRVAPQYPSLASSMNVQGTVKADVLVEPNGTVKSVEVKGRHRKLPRTRCVCGNGSLREDAR
jgi:hypothetical protein